MQKSELFKKESLEKEAEQYELKSRFAILAGERFDILGTKIFDMKKYFCYVNMRKMKKDIVTGWRMHVTGFIGKPVSSLRNEAKDFLKNFFHLYLMMITACCEMLKKRLMRL